jgi:hypothetical protein
MDGEPRKLMTTVEAADFLRLAPKTLEQHRVRGTGPRFMKAGPGLRARVLYDIEDLQTWVTKYGSTSQYAG